MRRLGTARQYDKYANREEDFTQAGQPTVRLRQLNRQGGVVGKPVQILKRARGVSPTSQRHDSQLHTMSVVNVTTITGGDCIG